MYNIGNSKVFKHKLWETQGTRSTMKLYVLIPLKPIIFLTPFQANSNSISHQRTAQIFINSY